jgi:hypothetical protein
MWDHRNRVDPSNQAAFLMNHRNEMPISELMRKRSSMRVKRPVSAMAYNAMKLHGVPRTYKSRITLSNVWGSKP